MSNKKGRPLSDPVKRFWSYVDKSNDCWLWTASLTASGYGSFYFRGKNNPASRISWVFHNGEIPEGKIVCHTCDERKCVRIDHLWLGTHDENLADAVNKKRFPSGENNRQSKLTNKERDEIIDLWMSGLNRVQIAEKYNVTPQTIHYLIKKKKNYLENARKDEVFKKLTSQIHEEILKRFNEGEIQKKLAQDYGIATSTISWIIRHKFKHRTVR